MLPAASPGAGRTIQPHSCCLPEARLDRRPKAAFEYRPVAAAAPLFTLTFGVRNLEWLSLCLQPPSWKEEENNREQADKSRHAGARLHLLDSDLCWSQLCLFSVWLTCCPNLTCSKS